MGTETKVKREYPILFSASMVRAILDGRKTQTRRVFREMEEARQRNGWNKARGWGRDCNNPRVWWAVDGYTPLGPFRCPYGQPGDVLWGRETMWRSGGYVATAPPRLPHEGKRPSIFMPRIDCRILLEVVSIRVEKVRKITPEDCWAEGILVDCPSCSGECSHGDQPVPRRRARRDFRELWDSINAKRGFGWAANPWVWAITFKRTEA